MKGLQLEEEETPDEAGVTDEEARMTEEEEIPDEAGMTEDDGVTTLMPPVLEEVCAITLVPPVLLDCGVTAQEDEEAPVEAGVTLEEIPAEAGMTEEDGFSLPVLLEPQATSKVVAPMHITIVLTLLVMIPLVIVLYATYGIAISLCAGRIKQSRGCT